MDRCHRKINQKRNVYFSEKNTGRLDHQTSGFHNTEQMAKAGFHTDLRLSLYQQHFIFLSCTLNRNSNKFSAKPPLFFQ